MENFFYILESLGVRHSFRYTVDLYSNQSGNRTLWGIKQLLQKYGVKVTAVKVESRSLEHVDFPFVFQGEDGFYVMTRKPEDPESFEKMWNGLALVCDTSKAREPYYILHKAKDLAYKAIPWIVLCAGLLLLATGLISPFSPVRALLAVFSLAGLYFSWKSAVNECSGSCSAVTESSAGKILGYSLSVIGMAWFGISAFTAVLMPQWLPFWSLMAVLALAMPLWSIIWQAFVLKAWCRNCLAVQVATVCCAVTAMAGGCLAPCDIQWNQAAALLSLFVMAVYFLDIAFRYYKQAKHPPLDSSILRMMYNPQLRDRIIDMGQNVDTTGFPGLWSLNPDGASQVFIALSLRCGHCRELFSRILQEQRRGRLSKYHFKFAVSGTGRDRTVVEVLAAVALQEGSPAALELLAQWYDRGNPGMFERLASKGIPMDGVKEMLDAMDKEVEKMNVQALPFVVLDGHEIAQAVFWADVELKN
ncbi:MAG: hypothetical protein IIX41_02940 [Bacteroidales bacterium]|nr:hypothetical protein [Bacteroidales bacterium]